jgi:hypothetical protein
MQRRRVKRAGVSDDMLGWIGLALALVAAIVLDKNSPPHKWHAAIMWTFLACFGALIFGREKRNSWLFWILWAMFLAAHVLAMWLIFAKLLPRLILGTAYVVPIAFLEAIMIFVIILKLERKILGTHAKL